jgi:hypothetical protein
MIFIVEAIAKMDDDGIMLSIYDDIHDEVKAKTKTLEKEMERVCLFTLIYFGQII